MEQKILDYYTEQSESTAISDTFRDRFPHQPTEIAKQVRKMICHPCELPDNFFCYNWPHFLQVRDIEQEFKTQKLVCAKCRDYTMLCVALIRAAGIPARARCGFATYFELGGYTDHWVVEYWDKDRQGWHLLDAQTKRYDLQTGQFINAATAWQLYRKYGFSADLFGFTSVPEFAETGTSYLIGNMVRDVSALLKEELSYVEDFPMKQKDYPLNETNLALLDKISDLILNEDIASLKEIYNSRIKNTIVYR